MNEGNIKSKSMPVDVAAIVTAIGAAVPAEKVVGRTIRQVVDNVGCNVGDKKWNQWEEKYKKWLMGTHLKLGNELTNRNI